MEEQKVQSTCMRCHRKLTDPTSVKRGIGPICWSLCNGGIFDKDLEATDEEWARREKLLRNGGEVDFGANWEYVHDSITYRMRISIRYQDEAFEVYGHVSYPGNSWEVIFGRCADVREAYRVAVHAGPEVMARAYAAQKAAVRAWKAQQKKRGVA